MDKNHYFGYDVYSGSFGGPLIPGSNKIKFFVSGEARNITDAEPSATGFPKFQLSTSGIRGAGASTLDTLIFDTDANGNVIFDEGARPKNFTGNGVNSDRGYNFATKLSFDVIASKLRIDLNGNFANTWRRVYTLGQLTWLDQVEQRRIKNLNIGTVATYTVNPSSFFDVGVNYFSNERRRMQDEYGFDLSQYPGKTVGHTGYTTYYNDNLLRDIGTSVLNFRRDNDSYIAFKSDYVNQFNSHNQFKAGFDYFRHTVRFLNIIDTDNPELGSNDNIGYTVASDNTVHKVSSDDLENRILGPAHPISFSTYLQDKLEYEGLVVRAGMRYDIFNPGIKRVKNLADPTGQTDPAQINVTNSQGRILGGTLGGEDYTSAKNDNRVSPRLSVSFPVSEKTQFRMSYGKFFQQPNLQDLYVSPDFLYRESVAPPFAVTVGNPNLHASTSTQYEVGLRRALSDKASIDINAYYKDISGYINSTIIASQPNSLITFTNTDEGVVQGLSISFELRRISKFQGRVAYTLQSARGTGSGENSGFRSSWLGYSEAKFNAPLAFDQRHTVNANLDIRNAKGEGPAVGGMHILENAGVNFLVNTTSGLPYTPSTIVPFQLRGVPQGRVVARRNSQNAPWTFRIDMKADKTIELPNNMNVNVYVQVLNLLDRKNVIAVFPATGEVNDNGYLSTPAGQQLDTRQLQQYQSILNDGLGYDTPRQARLGILFNF